MRQATVLRIAWAISTCAVVALASASQQASPDGVDLFDGLRDGWEAHWTRQRLASNSTDFTVVFDEAQAVLQADSEAAAAALWRSIDLRQPTLARLSWRWKIDGVLDTQVDERTRQGDDYAARVMVAFATDVWDSDTRALAYVWARDLPVGARFPNPYRQRVTTIVLRSGADPTGSWRAEERDLLADYERAFGELPDGIGGIDLTPQNGSRGNLTIWVEKGKSECRRRGTAPSRSYASSGRLKWSWRKAGRSRMPAAS